MDLRPANGLRSSPFFFFVVLLALLGAGLDPVSSRAVSSSSDPNACTICVRNAPTYVPHTRIHWHEKGRICVTKTFTRQDEWFECEEDRGKVAERAVVVLTHVPTCEICHDDSTQVQAWHKAWTSEDGSQCASAHFEPKGGA